MSNFRRDNAFIKESERKKRFQAALLSHFEHVHAAARAYMDFAGTEPKLEYSDVEAFRESVETYCESVDAHAKRIDDDLRHYWRSALVGVDEANKQVLAAFTKIYGDGKKKDLGTLHGKPGIAELNLLAKKLARAQAKFPKYEFADVDDVQHWKQLTKHCGGVILEAFEVHERVFLVLGEAERAKVAKRAGALGVAGRVAIAAIKTLLGLPPTP